MDPVDEGMPHLKPAVFSLLALTVYVLSLQFFNFPYAFATSAMIFVIGGLISGWDRKHFPTLLEVALLTGLGSEFVFTQIFTVVLP
jgi:hypothetical protein